MENADNKESRIGILDLLVVVLSIYVLVVLVVDAFFHFDEQTADLLQLIDNAICIFFLLDFCVRFAKAESKVQFMKWGWIDLLASIPAIDAFRAGRLVRLFRLLRVLRAFRSARHLVRHVYQNKAYGTFTTVSIVAVLLVLTSSIAVLQFEQNADGNIKTAEDALWWAYVTITTVGYGDKFPVTSEGRIVAAILMTAGVGLFGTFTGLVASWFLKEEKRAE